MLIPLHFIRTSQPGRAFNMESTMKSVLIIIGIILLFFSMAGAGSEKPGEKYTHVFGFDIYESSMEEVQKKFGNSKTIKTGDAGSSNLSTCYLSSDGQTVLEFNEGEISLGYCIRKRISEDVKKCSPISHEFNLNNITIAGLKLGMEKSSVEKLLGKPTESSKNTAFYDYSRQEKFTEAEIKATPQFSKYSYYDLTLTLELEFTGSVLSGFCVRKFGTL